MADIRISRRTRKRGSQLPASFKLADSVLQGAKLLEGLANTSPTAMTTSAHRPHHIAS